MKKGLFYFIMLATGGHLAGAALLGAAPTPRSGHAQLPPPDLRLLQTTESLLVGWNNQGRPIFRPLAGFRDPDYFGYPRSLRLRRMGTHAPRVPEYAQVKTVSEEIPVLPLAWERIPSAVDTPLDPEVVLTKPPPGMTTALPDEWELVWDGPLARRVCLVQVMPAIHQKASGKRRHLVLGGEETARGPEGLVLRVWADAAGAVRHVMVEGSSGDARVDTLMGNALRQWRFVPGEQGHSWGRAVLRSRLSEALLR